MPKHPAYHEEITGEIAEEKLRKESGPCFLFRYSVTAKCYQMAVKHDNKVEHIKLEIDKDAQSFKLQGSEKIFTSLEELVKYYQKNALISYITTIGQPCLKDPYKCCIL